MHENRAAKQGEEAAEGVEGNRETPRFSLPAERYDLRIVRSLRRIIRAVDVHSRHLAQEHGVTVPQLLCMLKIDELGPMTQKELSDAVFLNPSTIVGIIDRLEKAGILARQRSDEDRRRTSISLTPKGKQMVEESPSPLQQSLAEGIESLPELEKATIALALERIIELIDQDPPSATLEDSSLDPVLEAGSELEGSDSLTPPIS